ncbi:aspartate ammonia-lyase [Methanofollis formosanus]|uniref:Aspartate ammonia-lyase n=1 Tax=Methanofollis formosanus TaxID=299308 RepID=A0A8G1A0T4_9EURY|nr:aspartate ammonia-lyase [Methanofollis formosanus]QYZ78348.1 aspartate ammonia-lyase [Methanofollis formosanus]
MPTRRERDSLGAREVPADVYWGIQTLRAVENFSVSGVREPAALVRAYLVLKKAAAYANMALGEIDGERGGAIVRAADEGLEGRFDDQFPVDVFQAGAGTSFHMNVNEVLANRALELLGRERGDYCYLSPNDHVNRGQSTNDTFPTASHIAVITEADRLLEALDSLALAFSTKGEEFSDVQKSGRTHLMDALPLTLGDEFTAYATALRRAAWRVKERREDLMEVAIGGTASGTGANAHPQFRETVIADLNRFTGLGLVPAGDSFEALQSRAQMAAFSGALRELALELIRIANDLRLLGSGPTSGLAEVTLPAVQPGSSIMAGKVNPVMAECLDMVCFQVVGNDTAVALAAQAGQIDLNVMTPVMTYNILTSLSLLISFLPLFEEKCVAGIGANRGQARASLMRNPALATLLSPRIGYLRAAEIAEEARCRGVAVPALAVEKGYLTEKEAAELFDMERMARSLYARYPWTHREKNE